MEDSALSTRGQWLGGVVGVLGAVVVYAALADADLPAAARSLAAITVLMAVWWAAQPVPLAVTSLLPLAAYPLLGIASAEVVSEPYADPNVFLYLGGFIIALGLERWNLHRRIALHIMLRVGASPRRLVFGCMLATAGLSMWISNTATTLLMLPIALALLQTLEQELPEPPDAEGRQQRADGLRRFGAALLLGVAFSATCGGLSTLVGTPTNTAFRGIWLREYVPRGYAPISAAEWMTAFVPLALLMLLGLGLITTMRLGRLAGAEELGRAFCRRRLNELGAWSPGERGMLGVFLAAALLWMLREPLTLGDRTLLPGWGPWLATWLQQSFDLPAAAAGKMVDDSTVAMVLAITMFLLPGRASAGEGWRPLMDWATVQSRVPWGVLLLFGGGFAMADAFKSTGLATWLGDQMGRQLAGAPLWLLIAGVSLLVTVMSEFTSNVATVNTALPMLGPLAESLQIDPRMLLIPAAVSASFGFMLPVATPPNAIVFGTGRLTVRSMMACGCLLDALGVVLITGFAMTVIPWVFGSAPPGPAAAGP